MFIQETSESCQDYQVRVPHKEKKHLKWCLLDEGSADLNKVVQGGRGSVTKSTRPNIRHARVFEM